MSLLPVTGEPILVFYAGGGKARQLAARSDAEVVAGALALVRTLFGAAATEPTASVVTRWAEDPFALGSYSFLGVGSSADDRAALAAPIGGKVFFGGEATSVDHPSTMHGAYLSGQASARACLESLPSR